MQITITINECKDCRYFDHSGGFTPGGAIPVCGHHDVCYGNHASVSSTDTPVDVMMRAGMTRENAEKYVRRAERDDKDEKAEDKEIPMLLLTDHKKGDCYHWAHRVPFTNWENPSIPDWCPLKHGGKY
jgi:hypothetical protein